MAQQTDVFQDASELGMAWRVGESVLTFKTKAGVTAENVLVSSLDIQYSRPVNKLRSLTSKKYYQVLGKGSGTVSLGTIVGVGNSLNSFITAASNCQLETITVNAMPKTDCATGKAESKGMKFMLWNCMLQSLTARAQAGDMQMLEAGMTLSIGAMQVEDSAS